MKEAIRTQLPIVYGKFCEELPTNEPTPAQ